MMRVGYPLHPFVTYSLPELVAACSRAKVQHFSVLLHRDCCGRRYESSTYWISLKRLRLGRLSRRGRGTFRTHGHVCEETRQESNDAAQNTDRHDHGDQIQQSTKHWGRLFPLSFCRRLRGSRWTIVDFIGELRAECLEHRL